MTQTQLLAAVLNGISSLPEERRNRIFLCKAKIDVLVHEQGEEGMMALAIAGLEEAAKAEQEEMLERVKEAV